MRPTAIKRESGSVLIYSLVILTVITITAMVAIQRSSVQLKMVNNMQHSQDVFNAAYDYLNSGVLYLQSNIGVTRTALSQLVDTTSEELPTVALEEATNWSAPEGTESVKEVTDTLQMTDSTVASSGNYLKANSGSSSGTMTTYSFRYQATATDRSGRISSTQEIVFSLAGPAL